VCTPTTNIITILLVNTPDNLTRLTPLEVIGVKQRIHQNNNVHKRRREEMHDIAYKVLRALKVVARQPEANAKRVKLQKRR
jgi:hypothetical protein